MSTITVIATAEAPKALGPYSQGVQAGNLLFVSGQLGLDPATGALVSSETVSQAEQALKNIRAVLKAGGSDMQHIVKTTIFLTDLGDFAAVNEVYGRFFTPPYPARACVQVAALPKNGKIEIEVLALAV